MGSADLPNRKSLRLESFDYSSGGIYFLTLSCHKKQELFGSIDEGKIKLSPAGKMVESLWSTMPHHNKGLVLDECVVMPNHFHALIGLIHLDRVSKSETLPSISTIVRRFKTFTTRQYGIGVRDNGWPQYSQRLWQRSFWDRVVRSTSEVDSIREYIFNNPLQWELDELYC